MKRSELNEKQIVGLEIRLKNDWFCLPYSLEIVNFRMLLLYLYQVILFKSYFLQKPSLSVVSEESAFSVMSKH